MDNKVFIDRIREIFLNSKNPNFKIEEGVKGMLPVLKILYDSKEEVTPKDIENKLGITSARTARVLNQLTEKKYISRIKSKVDKRKTIVVLTEEGKKTALHHRTMFISYVDLMLNGITDDEKEAFLSIMQKMGDNLKRGK